MALQFPVGGGDGLVDEYKSPQVFKVKTIEEVNFDLIISKLNELKDGETTLCLRNMKLNKVGGLNQLRKIFELIPKTIAVLNLFGNNLNDKTINWFYVLQGLQNTKIKLICESLIKTRINNVLNAPINALLKHTSLSKDAANLVLDYTVHSMKFFDGLYLKPEIESPKSKVKCLIM